MGLPKLWDTIHQFEETVFIADLAESHYKRYGRPLRIAVDEADWRFNNLTTPQVYQIRDASNEQAFQGIEKAMFYRICKLLTLNIQLIFVFDGPGVPAKRGRNGGRKIDWEKARLLKQVLRCFGIPYQEAPGEAEAECARLQILGLVDAVWSQDSDCLMFGCSLWIHDNRVAKEAGSKDRSKENTKKSGKSVCIVRAGDLKDKLSLDREGLVLFAMLAGGDYHEAGLPGCGAGIALSAVKEENLAKSLCLCRNQRDCLEWSYRLAAFLQAKPRARHLMIPVNFPDFKILQKYYKPKITEDGLLMARSSLDLSNPRPIDERKLLEVTSSRFNIWGRLYMNWIGPVLLTRSLVQRDSSSPKQIVHDIKISKQRTSQSEEVMALRSVERKITFSPFGLTIFKREDFEGGERDGMWEGKMGVPFDPDHRVECDYFPAFWLRQVLPPDVLAPPSPAPKERVVKRKESSSARIPDESLTGQATKKRKSNQKTQTTHALRPDEHEPRKPQQPSSQTEQMKAISRRNKISSASPPKQQVRQQATASSQEIIDLSKMDDDEDGYILRLPPSRPLQRSISLRESLLDMVDLGAPESSTNESEGPTRAIHLGMQSPHLDNRKENEAAASKNPRVAHLPADFVPRQSSPLMRSEPAPVSFSRASSDTAVTPTTSCAAVASGLDQLRAARLKHFMSNPPASLLQVASNHLTARPAVAEAADYIDLTGD